MAEGRRQGSRGLRCAQRTGRHIRGRLRVLATGDHDDLGLGFRRAATHPLPPLHAHGLAICAERDCEWQVEGSSAVAAIEHHPQPRALRQRLHDTLVELVVRDLPHGLEVARDEGVVVTAFFVPAPVLLPTAVAAVVKEEFVAGHGAAGQPMQRSQNVRLSGHHVRAVIPQAADLIVVEAEHGLQNADHCLRVVDAARQLAAPHLQ
mmetsp:Transcript_52059/g.151567  ORF Transcript_52059/g.151567 Transcript_52059/m.151567 type:complete len:206 (+) Transcript_52059:479-1096(+)